MQVRKVSLTNFRNYEHIEVELCSGRNILIGDNAQGKTNFLEAIELISTGKSERVNQDLDLIKSSCAQMRMEIECDIFGSKEIITLGMNRTASDSIEKSFKINGVNQGSIRSIKRRLATVSFKSTDLNLIRGGPKFRRDWIDTILGVLKPMHEQALSKYAKVVAQRNRLLKQLFEKGRVSVTDNDQLRVWDTQLSTLGANIIKKRIALIIELLPQAEKFQEYISGKRELLSVRYQFKTAEARGSAADSPYKQDDQENDLENNDTHAIDAETLSAAEEDDISKMLLSGLKDLRYDEIRRKQTLLGPHRDDIQLTINGQNALYFASQGQQRTLVLSLKLAELSRITSSLREPPVLLLDDVMAELDLNRQSLLMASVGADMQTIITTTHISGFKSEWLEGALFLSVNDGQIKSERK
ncbi:MAG: DNA replication/repair protein RecF [Candidatus Obscuribacterales bacterium]|nr:DNA replication/repair protein RecF [Candidatus Obscuribacterales bacterium]